MAREREKDGSNERRGRERRDRPDLVRATCNQSCIRVCLNTDVSRRMYLRSGSGNRADRLSFYKRCSGWEPTSCMPALVHPPHPALSLLSDLLRLFARLVARYRPLLSFPVLLLRHRAKDLQAYCQQPWTYLKACRMVRVWPE